jgi:hypothetical protein
VLCKRHNNALSSVDATAGWFLKAILRAPDFLQSHEIRVLMLSGDDVGRWILKTLCTHIVAVRKFGDNWEPPSHVLRTAIRGFPNHLLFYRSDSGEIFVLRVVHGARDLGRLS